MAITKQFLSDQRVLLSFRLSINAAYGARKAFLVAEFNDWRPVEMNGDKSGGFSLTVEVDGDKPEGYEYRFVLQDQDGSERFTNDWHADEYRQNEFGTDNSVVHVVPQQQQDHQKVNKLSEPARLTVV
jgi:1,4-alpha-glucan branching enzyme